jgi:hypothetical protein
MVRHVKRNQTRAATAQNGSRLVNSGASRTRTCVCIGRCGDKQTVAAQAQKTCYTVIALLPRIAGLTQTEERELGVKVKKLQAALDRFQPQQVVSAAGAYGAE